MFIVGQVVLIASALVGFFLGVYVFIGGSLSRRSIAFSIAMAMAMLWSLFLAIFLGEENETQLIFHATVYYVATLPMAWGIFLTGMGFTKATDKQFWSIAIFSAVPTIFIILCIVLNQDFLFTGWGAVDGHNTMFLNPIGYLIFVIACTGYTLASVVAYLNAYKQAHSATGKRLMKNMLVGCVASVVTASIFNLWLPLVGNYQIIWAGPIGIILFAVTSYTAIVKFGSDEAL